MNRLYSVLIVSVFLILLSVEASSQALPKLQYPQRNLPRCGGGEKIIDSPQKDEIIKISKSTEYYADTVYLLLADSSAKWDTLSYKWFPSSKETYTYDLNQNKIEFLCQGWRDTVWGNSWKYVYTYDEKNNCQDKSFWSWINNQWKLYDKCIYTYDSTDKLIEELYLQWKDGLWTNYWKYIYTYKTDGLLQDKLKYYWNVDIWVLDWRQVYSYNEKNNLIETLEQWRNGSNNSWDTIGISSYYYDVNGNLDEYIYQIWRNNTWVNGFKYTYIFDLDGKELEEIYQMWDDTIWRNYSNIIFTYSTDGIQLGYLSQQWNGSMWIDDQKHTYSLLLSLTNVDKNNKIINNISLNTNYPNPFNPSTNISYSIPKESNVTLKIFDVLGREVATLVNERQHVGVHNIIWNAEGVPSGVYFYRIVADDFIQTKKMVLTK